MQKLLINGRFLADEKTAVNAVAFNLTNALCRSNSKWAVEVIVSKTVPQDQIPSHWNVRTIGTHTGVAWDQRDLSKLRNEGVIAGFFNTAPVIGRGHVTMLHDTHVFSTPQSYSFPTRYWRQFMSRRAGSNGNYVLTVSQYSKDNLIACGIGSSDRIGVVYNGLGHVGQVTPDNRILARLGLSSQHPYCVAASTLLPHKNTAVLLKAFSDPRLAHVGLVLFGKPNRRAFEAAGHYVPDNVTFAGFVSDTELAALYRGSRAVCVPSTQEGFGLPALEGMAFGKPAIIASCGALPEIVGGAGLVVSPHDVAGWANAILSLISDKDLHDRLGQAGKKRAVMFTWDAAGRTAFGHLDRWFP